MIANIEGRGWNEAVPRRVIHRSENSAQDSKNTTSQTTGRRYRWHPSKLNRPRVLEGEGVHIEKGVAPNKIRGGEVNEWNEALSASRILGKHLFG